MYPNPSQYLPPVTPGGPGSGYYPTPQPPTPMNQSTPSLPPRPSVHHQPSNANNFTTDLTGTVISHLNIAYTPGVRAKQENSPEYFDRVKLHQNRQELQGFETKADLYGVIVSLEHLESAFVRDVILPSEYTSRCQKLLAQYKTWMDVHKDLINNNLEQFIKDSNLTCPAALNRIKNGQPATLVHGGHEKSNQQSALAVADISDAFLTAIDTSEFTKERDVLLPLLNSLLESLLRYQPLPSNHDCTQTVSRLAQKLGEYPTAYYLTEEEAKALTTELDSARSSLRRFLAQNK